MTCLSEDKVTCYPEEKCSTDPTAGNIAWNLDKFS